jgi:hypothetical protein
VSKDSKDDLFEGDDITAVDYMVAGETVAEIVLALLNLVLAFVTPAQAKTLVDQVAVKRANEDADALERAKFGN